MRRVARNCPPVCCLLAVALSLSLPVPLARAQEPTAAANPGAPEDPRARLEAIYGAANQETQNGNFAAAADRYAEALALLPESHANHESRALALLDSVTARREAYARTRDPLQLCKARDLLRTYLLNTRTIYGTASVELDGPRQAGRLHGEIEVQLVELASRTSGPEAKPDGLSAATCPGDQAPPATAAPAAPPEPTTRKPPRPTRDPRTIAGITLLGVAGGSLGLMGLGLGLGAAAEKKGQAAHMADPAPDVDALLADGFWQRGQAANRLAIAGAVIAGVALVGGAALLIAARVRPRSAAAGGLATPRGRRTALELGGLGLGLRF